MDNIITNKENKSVIRKQRKIISADMIQNIRQGPGVVVVDRIFIIEREPHTGYMALKFAKFAFIFFSLHILFMTWSKYHKTSHNIFKWLLLLLFPILYSGKILFVLLLYLTLVLFIYKFYFRFILKFYFYFFKIFVVSSFIGNILLIATIILNWNYLRIFILLITHIYLFAITREVSQLYKCDFQQITGNNSTSCGICNCRANKSTITLSCNHSFHNTCIEGFYLIGNKKYCPQCNMGFDSLKISYISSKFDMINEILKNFYNIIFYILLILLYCNYS